MIGRPVNRASAPRRVKIKQLKDRNPRHTIGVEVRVFRPGRDVVAYVPSRLNRSATIKAAFELPRTVGPPLELRQRLDDLPAKVNDRPHAVLRGQR